MCICLRASFPACDINDPFSHNLMGHTKLSMHLTSLLSPYGGTINISIYFPHPTNQKPPGPLKRQCWKHPGVGGSTGINVVVNKLLFVTRFFLVTKNNFLTSTLIPSCHQPQSHQQPELGWLHAVPPPLTWGNKQKAYLDLADRFLQY